MKVLVWRQGCLTGEEEGEKRVTIMYQIGQFSKEQIE